MRRKIEKYLARKQGVEEGKIQYLDDGRFDFMGNLDGVLAAVRGKDGSGRSKRKNDKKKGTTNNKVMKNNILSVSRSKDPASNEIHGQGQFKYGPPVGSNESNKENKDMNSRRQGVRYSGEKRFGDVYALSPHNHFQASRPMPQQNISSKLMDDICLLSPGFIMSSSPKRKSKQNVEKSHTLQSPGPQKGLSSLFSPNLSINGMTPLSVSRDNLMKTPLSNAGFNIFSPDLEINRNLFSCTKATSDEQPSSKTLEVAVSPILKLPLNIPASKRRRYFTDRSLESPVGLFEGSSTSNLMSQDSSKYLAIVPLRTSKAVVTPGERDGIACGISFDSVVVHPNQKNDFNVGAAFCTPDNALLSMEDNNNNIIYSTKRKVEEM